MIKLIIGPMFSSKSLMLEIQIERTLIAKKKPVLLRPELDKRTFISRRSTKSFTYNIIKLNDDKNIENIFKEYDTICIDEFQFFKDKIVKEIIKNCIKYNKKKIFIAGLNASSEQETFNNISQLIPYVDDIQILKAICVKCGEEAIITKYKNNKKDQIKLDDGNYQPICLNCLSLENK